ncbi:MAG TPA: amidohydrolase [Vicinamibacterales bacterium]|nr:amidohydrolase [Vicinamibacterales bacterium]
MNRCLVRVLLASFVLAAGCQREPPPSHIFHTGKIVTVDPQFRTLEAMAIRDGRIVAVGMNADIVGLAGSGTEQVHLGGRTVLPGLIDSHVHAPNASMYEFEERVPDMESIEDVLAYVRARAETTDPGRWITLSQVFITRLREQRYPTRAELDRAAPGHPVAFRTGPDASLNSMALSMSGIDATFQVPDGQPCRVERDRSGQPTGILRNCARYIRSESGGSRPADADRLARLRELLADYNAVGITSIVDANTNQGGLELYRTLLEQDALTCRTFMAYGVDAQAPLDRIEATIREAASHPLHEYNDMLWLRGVKAFLDGGMLTGSAYMREPWGVSRIYAIDDPEYRGVRFIEAEKLYQIARLALANDLQFTAHSQGDAAVDAMVEAYERINRDDFPVRARRPSITHASFMSPEAIAKMQALGVVANLQPAWLYLDGATLRRHFGVERLAYFHPYRTLFEQGVTVGGGSDHMQKIGSLRSINPYNPFLGMWTTLVRQPRGSGAPLHPGQNLTREQAIRLYTINNAFLTFEEARKGSLEPGKLADFIVLDRDILSCPVDEVKDIKVEATYLGGVRVYARP